MVDDYFSREIMNRQKDWRAVVQQAVAWGLPVPGLAVSLAYFDAYRRERLPANLTQAQRDFFGAHTYERLRRLRNFSHGVGGFVSMDIFFAF